MANDPGEWYAEKDEEAAAFRRVLARARTLQQHAEGIMLKDPSRVELEKVAFRMRVVAWLVRELERAEYVGD